MAFLELEKERAILLDRPTWGVINKITRHLFPPSTYVFGKSLENINGNEEKIVWEAKKMGDPLGPPEKKVMKKVNTPLTTLPLLSGNS